MTPITTWIALNILDLGLTFIAIHNGASEWNASINWFNVNDTHEFIIWKVAFIFAFVIFVAYLGDRGHLNPKRIFTVCSLVMAFVCVWNLMVIGSVVQA